MAQNYYEPTCRICTLPIVQGERVVELRSGSAFVGLKNWWHTEELAQADGRGRQDKDLDGIVHAECLRKKLGSQQEG